MAGPKAVRRPAPRKQRAVSPPPPEEDEPMADDGSDEVYGDFEDVEAQQRDEQEPGPAAGGGAAAGGAAPGRPAVAASLPAADDLLTSSPEAALLNMEVRREHTFDLAGADLAGHASACRPILAPTNPRRSPRRSAR
jgi:hypothetical protein